MHFLYIKSALIELEGSIQFAKENDHWLKFQARFGTTRLMGPDK